jgi:nucleoside-diphosphate-sugar epimerase
MQERVLIAGASGFMGPFIAKRLPAHNKSIHELTQDQMDRFSVGSSIRLTRRIGRVFLNSDFVMSFVDILRPFLQRKFNP